MSRELTKKGHSYEPQISSVSLATLTNLRKSNALYDKFEEIGLNKQLGYESPADIVDKYPQFYWNNVSPHIQAAIDYLNVTSSGRWWIAGLYSNVFRAERELRHSGPQP